MIEQAIKDAAKQARYLSSLALGRYPKAFFSSGDFRERHEAFVSRVKENIEEQKKILVHSHLSRSVDAKKAHKLFDEIKTIYVPGIVDEEFRVFSKILDIAEQGCSSDLVKEKVIFYRERLADFIRVFESMKHLFEQFDNIKDKNEMMHIVQKLGHELHIMESYENDKLSLVEDFHDLDSLPSVITDAMKERRKSFLEQSGNEHERAVRFLKLLLPERKMSLGMGMVVEYLMEISGK